MLYALVAVVCLVGGFVGGHFFTRHLMKAEIAFLESLKEEANLSDVPAKTGSIKVYSEGEKFE